MYGSLTWSGLVQLTEKSECLDPHNVFLVCLNLNRQRFNLSLSSSFHCFLCLLRFLTPIHRSFLSFWDTFDWKVVKTPDFPIKSIPKTED